MAVIYYTVVKGDTLSGIAAKYKTTYQNLAKWNNIANPNLIYVGQKLKVGDSSGGTVTPDPIPATKDYTVTISQFGLQSDTDRTVFATWTFSRSNTDSYTVMWYYDTGNGVWFVGNDGSEKYKQSVYTAPSNAKRVKFKCKPVAKTRSVNGKETAYWTGKWCGEKTFSFSDAPKPPEKPPTPTVELDKYKLTASIDNYVGTSSTTIEFQVVKNDSTIYSSGKSSLKTNHASYSCNINAGDKYKVRCRAIKNKLNSEWSDYSTNSSSIPSTPSSITSIKGTSATSIYLTWSKVSSAATYDIQYTTNSKYFDSSDQVQSVTGITTTSYEKTGLESGREYFFRVRAVNPQGESAWSGVKSIVIGKEPSAPTTWSSTTTVITGGELILYWIHNSQDGSSATYSRLEITVNGNTETKNLKNDYPEEDKDRVLSYTVNTSKYLEGAKIQWRVQTCGVTNTYGEWSTQRIVDVNAPATLELSLLNNINQPITTVSELPIIVNAISGPTTQTPTGYHISIISTQSYTTVDSTGNNKTISEGDVIFSKYYDVKTNLKAPISAGDVEFENNVTYKLICTVSMNSGLNAEREIEFKTQWVNDMYVPNADIGLDSDNLTTHIHPYCIDENDQYIDNVTLSIYRKEFDGGFTLISDNIVNGHNTYVIDPHPALDFARYRIVATNTTTGVVSYYDPPAYPINFKSVVIQWDEKWVNFDTIGDDELEESSWSGSILRLPYNISISDKANVDVEFVNYIGRKRPVSYYGTQLNETSTWDVEIDKEDKDTLYAIRRLAIWSGDVYVREPSGSGYWANINVSYSQKYKDKTIPISFDITRVEGGV